MAVRPYWQFAALLLITLLTAGCGGGDDDEDNGGKADTAAKTTETTTAPSAGRDQTKSSRDGTETAPSPGATDTAPSTTGESAAPSRQALSRQAIASCRRNIDQNPQLTAGDKAALKKECRNAVSGDKRAAQRFSTAMCISLVRRAVQSGPERDLAVAACKRGGR